MRGFIRGIWNSDHYAFFERADARETAVAFTHVDERSGTQPGLKRRELMRATLELTRKGDANASHRGEDVFQPGSGI